jgi:hypothetical protein
MRGVGLLFRDLHYKIEETRSKARSFLEERIPFENEVCRIGLYF